MVDLSSIDDLLISDETKGMPGNVAPFRLADIGAKNWNVLAEDLPLPLAVLKESALAHNGAWMRRFLEQTGTQLSPHGKTSMSPQLFARQLADGAWAITVATVQQIQVCRRFGFERILLANQLIGRPAIAYVLNELKRDPDLDFYCLVDSVDGVDTLASAAREIEPGRPLQVLLEGGLAGGRTGCRELQDALTVARAVKAAGPFLALRGVEGFEGLIAGETSRTQERHVGEFLDYLVAIARAVDSEKLFADGPVLLTAGGSAFYDMVIDRFHAARLSREVLVVTRSGCYLTHDSGLYDRFFKQILKRSADVDEFGAGPCAAFEVWTYVQSRPEPEKAILSMGQRDAGRDVDWPTPMLWYRPGLHETPVTAPAGSEVTGMNDQHTHMKIAADAPYQVGDLVAFGVSHPCTTFDKWDVICLVDDGYTVTSAIKTFF